MPFYGQVPGPLAPTAPALVSVWNRGSFVDGNLHVQMSNDGRTFFNRPTYQQYTPHDATMFGIPCLLPWGSGAYAAGSKGVTTTDWTGYTFELAKTQEFDVFKYAKTVDCSSLNTGGSSPQVWPCSFFTDSDGSIHVIIEYCATAATYAASASPNFNLFEVHPLDSQNLEGAWSNPAALTGTFSGPNQIDGQIIKVGSTYYLFHKSDTGNRNIEVASASALLGPYSVIVSGDGLGFGNAQEAPCFRLINGIWRAWWDDQGNGIYTAQSLAAIPTSGWSGRVLCTAAFDHMQHGGTIPNLTGH